MPERDEHMLGLVPERNGYIPGVPCWVDASEPDPEAAAGFYKASPLMSLPRWWSLTSSELQPKRDQ